MQERTPRAPSARHVALVARIRAGVLCWRDLRCARRRNIYHHGRVKSDKALCSTSCTCFFAANDEARLTKNLKPLLARRMGRYDGYDHVSSERPAPNRFIVCLNQRSGPPPARPHVA